MKKLIKQIFNNIGCDIIRKNKPQEEEKIPPDILLDKNFIEIYEKCKNYTMTGVVRMYSLYNSVEYIIKNKILGDFVEAGVWRGGSVMLIAMVLKRNGITDKKIYLYDTFDGMVEPTEHDVNWKGINAKKMLEQQQKSSDLNSVHCFCPIETVKENIKKTGYYPDNFIFVKGDVVKTIDREKPTSIALLRVDTDWYESTYFCLKKLFPLVENGGVLILDDYGHWEGAKKAADEYFIENDARLFLNRVDYTGRLVIKN